MGKRCAGKTSMRSIIFANYIAHDTLRLPATIDVETTSVKFLGNLALNLWDCGGQESFFNNYLTNQRNYIFRSVEVLIYVFDIESTDTVKELEMNYFSDCLVALQEFSPDAKIFCLIHKMDLVPEAHRENIFKARAADLQELTTAFTLSCFRTSIWDDTLYKAWSAIVHSLIPGMRELESGLNKFCRICSADEVVLFERETFLVISHMSTPKTEMRDEHRFEKISNIIKQFKLCCSKSHAQFQSMEVKNSSYTAYIDLFTQNSYIMMVTYDLSIQHAILAHNIQQAKTHFARHL